MNLTFYHCHVFLFQNRHTSVTRSLQDQMKSLEKMLSKKELLSQKKDETIKHIRDLGTLPSDAFEKYTDTAPRKVTLQ